MKKTQNQAKFTKEMKKTHTIFLPNMLPYHNDFLKAAFRACGYRLEICEIEDQLAENALPFISGDYCLPAMLILGQMLAEIKAGKYPVGQIAFMEPQTGGACRAGHYYNSIIQSLKKAGYSEIPVISLNAFGEEKHPGFSITPKLVFGAAAAVCYGDLLMTLYQQVRPYEKRSGQAKECLENWQKKLEEKIAGGKDISRKKRIHLYRQMVQDFSAIPTQGKKRKRVGVAGEIYMKFSPVGNEHLEDFLQKQDVFYRMEGFLNYVIYVVDGERENQRLKGMNPLLLSGFDKIIRYLSAMHKDMTCVLEECGFLTEASFANLKKKSEPIIQSGCHVGDGWLIAGEVADLIEQGCDHILILHPFGCLVSHVCERGILKKLHQKYPGVNIQTIEYDYDSSKALRESRILLGMSEFTWKDIRQ